MTMPHLMNCPHSGDGWCLDCVQRLQKDQERIDFLATCNEGWPIVEEIKVKKTWFLSDLYYFIADVMPDSWEPTEKPIESEKMREAFRMMIDEAIDISLGSGKYDG